MYKAGLTNGSGEPFDWKDLMNQELIVLGGINTVDQSTILTGLVKEIVMDNQIPVGFLSLHSTMLEYMIKFIGDRLGLDREKFKSGNLSEDDLTRIKEFSGKVYDSPLWFEELKEKTVQAVLHSFKELIEEREVKAVFVDSLDDLEGQDEPSEIFQIFKDLMKEHRTSLIFLTRQDKQDAAGWNGADKCLFFAEN